MIDRVPRLLLFSSVLLAGFLGAGGAQAAPIVVIDVDPVFAGVQAGTTVPPGTTTVAIHLLGIDASAPLNAFQLALTFDPSLAAPVASTLSGFLLAPITVVENDLGVGRVSIATATLGPGAVFGDGLLATVTLDVFGPGTVGLALQDVLLSQPFGVAIPGTTTQGATLFVAPEPGAALLLIAGLGSLFRFGRRVR